MPAFFQTYKVSECMMPFVIAPKDLIGFLAALPLQ